MRMFHLKHSGRFRIYQRIVHQSRLGGGYTNLLFRKMFKEKCMKMKDIGPRAEGQHL